MNTNNKYKFNMKGWFKDSWRHTLAARGIKTKYDKAESRKYLYFAEKKKRFSEMTEEEQLKEVEAGNKPIALISDPDVNSNLPYINYVIDDGKGGFIIDKIFHRSETKDDAERLKKTMEDAEKKREKGKFNFEEEKKYHESMGKNLGYSKKEIKRFIKQKEDEEFVNNDNKYDAKKPTSTWSEPSVGPQLVGRHKQHEPLPTVSKEFLNDVSWLKDQGASYKDVKLVYPDKKPAVKAAWMKIEGVEEK